MSKKISAFAILIFLLPALAQSESTLPVDHFTGLTLDTPLQTSFTTGEAIRLGGILTDTSLTLIRFQFNPASDGDPIYLDFDVIDGRFDGNLLPNHGQAGQYNLNLFARNKEPESWVWLGSFSPVQVIQQDHEECPFIYTAADCKTEALAKGLRIGGEGYDFEDDYGTKGCYAYDGGTYEGIAFFGTGGDAADMEAEAQTANGQYRVTPCSEIVEGTENIVGAPSFMEGSVKAKVDPPVPTIGDEISLIINGIFSSPDAEIISVDVARTDNEIVVKLVSGWVGDSGSDDEAPFESQVHIGFLPTGEYEVMVSFNDTDLAATTFTVLDGPPPAGPVSMDGDLTDGDQEQRLIKGGEAGGIIEVQLNISDSPEIKGWSAIIEFDSDQAQFTGVFAPSSFVPGLIALNSSKDNGVSLGGTVLGSNATGSGDGTLGQFSVELLEGFSDQMTIRIVEVTLNLASGEREILTVDNELVISSEVGAPTLAGDFDGSGKVDFIDFFMFADGFGRSDPLYDLDTSGKVDFTDFFIFADNFGKEDRAKLIALAIELIGLPQAASLGANYPNPFNSETTIPYAVGTQGPVTISLFDISGQLIRELVNHIHVAGQYKASWDGRDSGGSAVSSGVYLVRLASGNHNETKKIMLMK